MVESKRGWWSARILRRRTLGVLGVVGAIGLLIGSQLPAFADAGVAPVNTALGPNVAGARLVLRVNVSSSTHDYNATAGTCYRAANFVDECNVTVSVNGSSACVVPGNRCHDLQSINYTVQGSALAPTTFFLVNSNPTLPIPGLPQTWPICVGSTCSTTSMGVHLWFSVIPSKGTIVAWVQINTLT